MIEQALLERLRSCVGSDIAVDVDPDEQVELVLDLLERARSRGKEAVEAAA